MTVDTWAVLVSFLAMFWIAASYFFQKKIFYLLFQSLGIVFLIVSYLLTKEYFAMVGVGLGLLRAIVYFLYEWKNKDVSIAWAFVFSALSVTAYFVINFGILQTAKPVDILYLLGLIGYAFITRIRDLEQMRYLVTVPTALSLLYTVLSRAVVFVSVSYAFELGANLISIGKYHLFDKNKGSVFGLEERNKHRVQSVK